METAWNTCRVTWTRGKCRGDSAWLRIYTQQVTLYLLYLSIWPTSQASCFLLFFFSVFRFVLTESTISGSWRILIPGLLPIFLHGCEMKSESGLGTRLALYVSSVRTTDVILLISNFLLVVQLYLDTLPPLLFE